MAKSMRSKREKRLRTLRREIAEPFHEKKEVAKLAAQDAALAAPKLPVRPYNNNKTTSMEITTNTNMDVEMGDVGSSHGKKSGSLKAVGGIGKKMKKKLKVGGRGKNHIKGKARRKHNI
ncbi:hypothetical protein BVC80_1803g40 [Macleaya cordata]|uniref:Uncharacterized protein n=1 Tax=Macleaya cordata TaxID=56857 RepID=A0A200QR37_MACCD|nr:hypothetical protein BVC80_1803g40 [Macleaya cordata]